MSTPLGRAWAPALLWLAVIALESTPLASAENTGSILRPLLTFLCGAISPLRFVQIHSLLRKAGHFFGYAVLSLVMARAWWATLELHAGRDLLSDICNRWSLRAAALALLSTLAVAGLDEWHQGFLLSRTGSPADVALDAMAGVFAQMALIVVSGVGRSN